MARVPQALKNYEKYLRKSQFQNSTTSNEFLLTAASFKIKSNFHYTRRITPKRVTSCGAHLRGLVPGQHSSEESSQRWRVVGETVTI